jgi:hypothetical protein
LSIYFVVLAKSVKFRINQCSGIVKLALRNQRRNNLQAVNPLRIKMDASKLRGAIVRAGRKRKRSGFQNSSGFNPKNLFRGFGQASTVKNQFNTPNSSNLPIVF